MAIKGLFYIEAHVSDLERSKEFYGNTLGWKLETDLPEVAGYYFGEGYLVLLQDKRPTEDRVYGGGMAVEVMVDDIEEQHARLTQLGIRLGNLETKPWGESKFTFTDPDGYSWAYGQPATRA